MTLASLYPLLYLGDLLKRLKRSNQVCLFKFRDASWRTAVSYFFDSINETFYFLEMFYFSRSADTSFESHQSGGLHIRHGCSNGSEFSWQHRINHFSVERYVFTRFQKLATLLYFQGYTFTMEYWIFETMEVFCIAFHTIVACKLVTKWQNQ